MSDEDETTPPPAEAAETVRSRLEEATRNDPRRRFRILVAAHVLLIVDRQIGRGEGPLEAEWQRLAEMVKDHPGALELVDSLRAAVTQCEATVTSRLAEGKERGLDEAAMRAAILTFIRAAVLEKLQLEGAPKDASDPEEEKEG
jgi:hypothetical protein